MSLALVVGCGDDSSADSGLTFTTTLDSSTGDDSVDDDGSTSGSATDASMTASMSASVDDTSSEGEESTSAPVDSTGTDSTTTGDPSCEEVDVPDINGLDENGDGIDGVVCRAIFVNGAVGSDLNDGTAPDTPVATIQHAIDVAQQSNPPRMVLVAEGNYVETINLNSGVSIYGGYDGADWARNVGDNLTEITATEERAIIGQNLDAEVEVDGFTIHAMDFVDESATSYGVWIRDTPDGIFALDYCVVDAGNGGSGANGADGENGQDGGSGDNASGGLPGSGGTSACNATGGNGGSGQACPATDGGDGAAGGDPTTIGQGGPAGASSCGADCDDEGTDATPGNVGHAGVNGDGGAAASDNEGTFGGDGIWVPPVGDIATRGNHGSGGGGGGAGGFDEDSGVFCLFDSGEGIGGGGGGGGAGGCGGDPGETGHPGGGSFAIVSVNSSIAVTNVDIFLGDGGNGGNGGNGGDGGTPGAHGFGVSGIDNGGEPGDGRDGGDGGGGGGGGGASGGCGGASVGIALVGDAEVGVNNVSFSEGVGGAGGTGGTGGIRADGLGLQADPGADGCEGFRADQAEF